MAWPPEGGRVVRVQDCLRWAACSKGLRSLESLAADSPNTGLPGAIQGVLAQLQLLRRVPVSQRRYRTSELSYRAHESGAENATTRIHGAYLQGLQPALHSLLLACGLAVLGGQDGLCRRGARQRVAKGGLQQNVAPELAQQLLKDVPLQLAQGRHQHLRRPQSCQAGLWSLEHTRRASLAGSCTALVPP